MKRVFKYPLKLHNRDLNEHPVVLSYKPFVHVWRRQSHTGNPQWLYKRVPVRVSQWGNWAWGVDLNSVTDFHFGNSRVHMPCYTVSTG